MRRALLAVVMLGLGLALAGHNPIEARPAPGQVHTLTLVADQTLTLAYHDGVVTRIAPQDGRTDLLFGNAPGASGPAWLRDLGLAVTDTSTGTVYCRSYVGFPPLSLPPHSEVTATTLHLYITDCFPLSPTSTVSSFGAGVYPLLGEWAEDMLVAWSDTDPAYVMPTLVVRPIQSGASGDHEWDVLKFAGRPQFGFLLSGSPMPDDPAGLIARADNRLGAMPPTLEVTYVQRTPPVLREPVYAGATQVRGAGGPGESVDVYDADTGALLGAGLIDQDGTFTLSVSPALALGQRIIALSDYEGSNVVVVQPNPAVEVPEWPTLFLVGGGLAGLWAWLRQRRG
ncbi:MAG: hypothetical protein KKA73_10185 [Chloroflexi bacterium]|nr:hypothetical protein [Chloroflexota bacterium]MBU1748045.1 hypothetical protein [Chloroflexota bacterium]